MESEVIRRRINTIAAHFASNDDIPATHIIPLNCSSSLNSVISRRDNKMYFARQASDSLGHFMRQALAEEARSTPSVPPKSYGSASEGSYNASEAPFFSRPAKVDSNVSMAQSATYGSILTACEPPKFARPSTISGDKQFRSRKIYNSANRGIEWSPRMDVVESERKYLVTVEVPGVSTGDIRVEVDDQKLSVTGKRFTNSWKVSGSKDSLLTYHKREILHGPYEVLWPLPTNVNKDGVSAEFLDGFLKITVPKL
ncbi:putative Small heat-shock protein [Quillaja saponaria]|uniref:Small heat-shock protein n=1 Tax=Quillaja saponaria TaxID=32244 RepID=A0AAD7LM91_QUISA|nr:putative Small heat-shock protein [Quillaja saponaria]